MTARTRKTPLGNWRAKLAVAAFAAVLAFAGAHGFAATLGADATGLEAGSKVVASCGNGMTLAYTATFDAASSGYVVNAIELENIPAGCRSKSLSATFYDSGGITVGSAVDATLTASGTTQSIAIAPGSNTIDADRVSGVSIVVT